MEWRKYKKYIFKRHSIKISKRKKIWIYIYKFYDLGQHIFLFYTVPSNSYQQDILQKKCFLYFGPVWMFISWRLGTAEYHPGSGAQVLCASLLARCPAHELFRSQCESINLFLVMGGCSGTCSFLPHGKKDLYIKADSKALDPFGGYSGWTFHINKDLYDDCYRVKLKRKGEEVIDSFCSYVFNSSYMIVIYSTKGTSQFSIMMSSRICPTVA